jgi:biotin carboxyl carrier protein
VAQEVELLAPMSGSIKELLVGQGARVTARQEVVLMESMKMEIPVEAPVAGTIAAMLVGPDDKVDEGQVLLRISVETAG